MRYEQSVEFRCTAAQLWPYLVDPELTSEWMYRGRFRLVPDGAEAAPVRAGTSGTLVSARGEEIGRWHVTAVEPLRHLAVELQVSMLGPRRYDSMASFTLHEELGATRIDYVNDSELGFMGNLLSRLLGGLLTRRGWKRLRQAVEQPLP